MRWIAGLLVALLSWSPVMAFAAPPRTAQEEEARNRALDVFNQGKTAYKAHDYGAALTFFRKAQAIYQHEALIILALAKTLDKAGDGERALQYYMLFLKEAAPDDPGREGAVSRVAALEAELAARPGVVILENLPSGAEVFVDGKSSGVDHRSALDLKAGSYVIRVTMRDRLPFERNVVVTSGRDTRLAIILVAPVDPTTLARDHRWTWIAGGLASAGLLATGVFALRGGSLRNEYGVLFDEKSGRATETGRKRFDCSPTATTDDECPALIAEGVRLQSGIQSNDMFTATAGIATAALAIGAGIAFFAAPVKPVGGEASASLTPAFSRDGASLALTLRF
jgi:hypothetical protein